jgi:tRNA (guanine-N7-)-methyltransferase
MQRTIKSFVLRAGKMTIRQKHGLNTLLKNYALPDDSQVWDFAEIFANQNDVIVEIGFGMGSSLLEMALSNPSTNFIGVEVHLAGVGSLAADLDEHEVNNVKIVNFDAAQIFAKNIPSNSLSGIQIFFPDPWHKKRHNKRRLIQSEFVKILVDKLKPGGVLHCATDWQDYAEHILQVLQNEESLDNLSTNQDYVDRPKSRPMTKFEKRGIKLGHGVWDLQFIKKTNI